MQAQCPLLRRAERCTVGKVRRPSTVSKECFLSLESPPTRVCGADTPFPLVWEPFYLPRQAKVAAEIKESLNF